MKSERVFERYKCIIIEPMCIYTYKKNECILLLPYSCWDVKREKEFKKKLCFFVVLIFKSI